MRILVVSILQQMFQLLWINASEKTTFRFMWCHYLLNWPLLDILIRKKLPTSSLGVGLNSRRCVPLKIGVPFCFLISTHTISSGLNLLLFRDECEYLTSFGMTSDIDLTSVIAYNNIILIVSTGDTNIHFCLGYVSFGAGSPDVQFILEVDAVTHQFWLPHPYYNVYRMHR